MTQLAILVTISRHRYSKTSCQRQFESRLPAVSDLTRQRSSYQHADNFAFVQQLRLHCISSSQLRMAPLACCQVDMSFKAMTQDCQLSGIWLQKS